MTYTLGKLFLEELQSEERATRQCLERIPIEKLAEWKPHEKSMKMGYLAQLVAELPKWIAHMITTGDIDFATWQHTEIKTTQQLVKFFDKNMEDAKAALGTVSDEELHKDFSLKNQGQVLFSSPKKENIMSSINHLVHHRGQLTVYMRLNNILVPSIYGPSADEKVF